MSRAEKRTVHRTIGDERAEADLYPGGEHGVLVLHGFASDRRELGPLPETLHAAGLSVVAFDLRGHGASQGLRGGLSRERVLADIRAWRDVLADEGAACSVLAGHSLGGLWMLAAAPEISPQAVVAIASPASIRSQLSGVEEVGYRIAGQVQSVASRVGGPTWRVPYEVELEELLDHPRAIEQAREMDLLQPDVPLSNVDELMAVDGPSWARKVQVPTLVAYGCRDAFIERSSTHRIFEALPGEATWMELPGPHSMFLDVEAEECARRVATWIDRTVG